MKLTKEDWDRQFRERKWDHLLSLQEAGHNALIASYCHHFHRRGTVLDVGCGFGVLAPLLQCQRYVGIDFSSSALEKTAAVSPALPHCTFHCIDLTAFTTEEKFDAIIFNEVLYYVDGLAMLQTYASFLREGGSFIISLWKHPKTEQLWKEINRRYSCLDSSHLQHQSGNEWVVGVFRIKTFL